MIRFHRQRCARRWRANACTKSPSSVTIMSKLWWTVRRYVLPALHIDTLSNVRAPSSRLLSTSRGSRVYVSFRTNISPEIYSCVRLANIKYLVNVFVTTTTTGLSWGFVCSICTYLRLPNRLEWISPLRVAEVFAGTYSSHHHQVCQ